VTLTSARQNRSAAAHLKAPPSSGSQSNLLLGRARRHAQSHPIRWVVHLRAAAPASWR